MQEIKEYMRIAEDSIWTTGYEHGTSKSTEYWTKVTRRKVSQVTESWHNLKQYM